LQRWIAKGRLVVEAADGRLIVPFACVEEII
jgi:hypothetical protein